MNKRRIQTAGSNKHSSTLSTLTLDAPSVDTSESATQDPLEEEIRQRAYECWEAAGRPVGDGSEFWFQAERELARKKPR